MPALDLVGQKFGRWAVLSKAGYDAVKNSTLWNCRCECGNERVVLGNSLRSGKSKSCGCLHSERTATRNTRHGYAVRGHRHPAYGCWKDMRKRCYQKNFKQYANYGGRGIRMCTLYQSSFTAFLEDIGERPEQHSVDRVDVNGHYSCGKCEECQSNGWPMNVRWASVIEQANNKRDSVRLTYKGQTKTIAEWAREVGLKASTISTRIFIAKWSVERSLETPYRKTHIKSERYRLRAIRNAMIQRCTSEKSHSFPNYGGRGITVCERWLLSVDAFISDMGPRPTPKHSIDRIDNDKGYWCGRENCRECSSRGCIGNCRWATREEQCANRSRRKRNLTAARHT